MNKMPDIPIGKIGKAGRNPACFPHHPLKLDFEHDRLRVKKSYRPWSSLLTVTVDANGTYRDAEGVIQKAGMNQPRFDYSTGRRGLLVEEERTNLLPYSSDLSYWSKAKSGTGESPVINTIDSDTSQDLPDATQGSDAGKGFSCTGLTWDAEESAFWVGNFGKATPAGSSDIPQLIKLSGDGTAITAEIEVSYRMQGVALDTADNVLYYAATDLNAVYKIEKNGTGEAALISGLSAPNGLAYDSKRDELWITEGTELNRYSKSGVQQLSIDLGFTADHIWHDAAHDWIWITYGASGGQGYIRIIRVSDGSIVKIYRLEAALAVEGILVKDGRLYIANDGYYHNADIGDADRQKNQLQTYPMSYGIVADSLPDYLKLELGASGSGADNSFLTYAIASNAARTFGVYMKAAHDGETPALSLRMDDTTSTEYEDFETGADWERQTHTKLTGTTTQTVKIILRGDHSADTLARVWVQAADVQNGTFMTSHIPTNGATVTRSADMVSITGTDFSDWFNADEGTFLVDFAPLAVQPASVYASVVNVTDGTANNRMSIIHRYTTGAVRMDVLVGSAFLGAIGDQNLTSGAAEFAAAYKAGDYAASMDGSTADADTFASVPAVDRLFIGGGSGASPGSLVVHEIGYFSKKLDNERLRQ